MTVPQLPGSNPNFQAASFPPSPKISYLPASSIISQSSIPRHTGWITSLFWSKLLQFALLMLISMLTYFDLSTKQPHHQIIISGVLAKLNISASLQLSSLFKIVSPQISGSLNPTST